MFKNFNLSLNFNLHLLHIQFILLKSENFTLENLTFQINTAWNKLLNYFKIISHIQALVILWGKGQMWLSIMKEILKRNFSVVTWKVSWSKTLAKSITYEQKSIGFTSIFYCFCQPQWMWNRPVVSLHIKRIPPVCGLPLN